MKSIRNVGIIAHIDAGKTTTTESMLYHAGLIRSRGNVDRGDTVMDYMEEERERGITINSAAISFQWKKHRINLIDTPGHVDFTFEVERAVSVLDGAVAILDAAHGVEVQSETVWRQADQFRLAHLVFINKMDSTRAHFDKAVDSLRTKLRVEPLVIQVPNGQGRQFAGPRDVLDDPSLRVTLLDRLAELDSQFESELLTLSSYDKVTRDQVLAAIRRCTLSGKAVPVLCGSALKDVGVEQLMDAIVAFLPSAEDRASPIQSPMAARCFKTTHCVNRGMLSFIRVYHGTVAAKTSVFNASQECSDSVTRAYEVKADELMEVDKIDAGNIGAVSGLKKTQTGDFLVRQRCPLPDAVNRLLRPPDPVFFCSVEPASTVHLRPLEDALQRMSRDDPSLRVETKDDQLVLWGMGELHLDIVRQRLLREAKIEVDFGPLQVAFREELVEGAEHALDVRKVVGGSSQEVHLRLSLRASDDKELVHLVRTRDESFSHVTPPLLNVIREGVSSALQRGPLKDYPVHGAVCDLHAFAVGRGTALSFVRASVAQTVQEALRRSSVALQEPVMMAEIVCPNDYASVVIGDLDRRRGHIDQMDTSLDGQREIVARIPMATMTKYSSDLRTITRGHATLRLVGIQYQRAPDGV